MQNLKITKILAVSLLTTIFNISSIDAATAASTPLFDENTRTDAKVLHYYDPKNAAANEACFAIVDEVRKFHNVMDCIPIIIMRGINEAYPFTDVLIQLKHKRHQRVEAKLQNVSSEEKTRAIAFADGAFQRALEIYQPFGDRISRLFNKFKSAPLNKNPGYSPAPNGSPCGSPFCLAKTELDEFNEKFREAYPLSIEQCEMLLDLFNLKQEIKIARAHAPGVGNIDYMQLFLYIANIDAVKTDTTPLVKRKPAISKLYAAYGESTLKDRNLAELEYAAAKELEIGYLILPGQIQITYRTSYTQDVEHIIGGGETQVTRHPLEAGRIYILAQFKGNNTRIITKEQILEDLSDKRRANSANADKPAAQCSDAPSKK